jgi:hypothetical protein
MARLGTPARDRSQKRSRTGLIKVVSVVAVGALLVGGAVVANGFDVKQTPLNDASVWALNNADGRNRYARVNTDLGELDSVKTAESANAIVQTTDRILLFASQSTKVADINPAKPLNLKSDDAEFGETPSGTESVVSSEDYVGYLTSDGDVWVAPIAAGGGAPVQVDPYASDTPAEGEEKRAYSASVIAISTDGTLYSYSAADSTMLRYNIAAAHIDGQDAVDGGPTGADSKLTVVGSTWVLVSSDGDSVWIDGRGGATDTPLGTTFKLQAPSSGGSVAYIADDAGLYEFTLSNGQGSRVFGSDGSLLGTPAAPYVLEANVSAAWLDQDVGTLYNNVTGDLELEYGPDDLPSAVNPEFRSNGSRVILNDTTSGWVWTVPNGKLVQSSLDWSLATNEEQEELDEQEQATEVLDPKPPVAEADSFGVRAGQQVILPVLLNDHDPNEDILTIAADSLTGLDPVFGTVSVIENSQAIAVDVAPGASGTATFTYRVTDGTAGDGGRLSEAARVTLTVYDSGVNNAPEWCGGADECLKKWPEPEVLPGGTVNVPVLSGWVDPEGDPIFVSSVENPEDVGAATSTTAGVVVYQHGNRASQESRVVPLTVTISDTRQATNSKVLEVRVSPNPELTVEPFALTTVESESLTVDPVSYVSGVTGTFSVTAATVPTGADNVTATPNGGPTFEFEARDPGSYLVSFVVADDVSEVETAVRVTVLSEQDSALSTAPVTVFVRPKVDTTVDVFSAVSNPAGRVLLLSDAVPKDVQGSTLDVDIVGQKVLRVRGEAADLTGGKIGVVGYTVSDGRDGDGGEIRGQATVYMLPPVVAQAPLAVADSVVVRINAQIDIPVLDNDIAPNGNILVLNPSTVENPSKKGLAFGSGSVVRYLAPSTPGTYELRYDVYSAGSPKSTDQGIVRVEVLPNDENLPPRPRPLTGRVLSGETILVPFDGYGIDPDGDEVILETIVSQPSSGTASISSDGSSITYSSVIGYQGAVDFEYSVRDSRGDSGTSVVRIGVLDQQSDPAPITFTDYVEVQQGADNTVNVYPLANDLDPAGYELTLETVQPDAEKNSAEYNDLLTHLGTPKDGQVVLTAGDVPDTYTFAYTVKNSEGDIGAGYIVLKVVRDPVPDFPVVIDTVLSIEDRAKFPQGIDIVTGKVSWATGDIGGLELSLYGKPDGVSVSGWKIKGDVPDDGLMVPFVLSGPDFSGATTKTYGFFRIPAKDSIILSLKSGDVVQNVKESQSVTFDMAKLVPVPTGDVLEVSGKGLRASGQRASAQCSLDGTAVTYKAGAGSPWSDSCAVPVRLVGQTNFTQLVVPIAVEPPEPQPELRPGSYTLSPAGDEIVVDLDKLVRWQGAEDYESLKFALTQNLTQFHYSFDDDQLLTLKARDEAVPGREETITLGITSHQNVASTRITLKVGPAPAVVPKGGTTTGECFQSRSSCTINVIGIPGEYNVFDTPLTLNDVESTTTCPGVTLSRANDRSVAVSWTADAAGGKCEAHFTVRDAQKKVSSAGDRDGLVIVDFNGYPKAAASVEQASYADKKLQLRVDPGAAASAYPALEEFVIYRGTTRVGSCTPSGDCPQLTTNLNGDKQTYTVKAKNKEGEALAGPSTEAWSYAAPGIGTVTATAVYDPAVAAVDKGAVSVVIQTGTPAADGYYINGSTSAVPIGLGGSTTVPLALAPGQRSITVVPKSVDPKPTHGVGPPESTGQASVVVIGKPKVVASGNSAGSTNTSITVPTPSIDPNSADPGAISTIYVAYQGNQRPTCTVNPQTGGNLSVLTPFQNASSTVTMSLLQKHQSFKLTVCVSNGYGVTQVDAGSAITWEKPATGPTNAKFDVLNESGGLYPYTVSADDYSDNDFHTEISSTAGIYGKNPNITARWCFTVGSNTQCSDPTTLTYTNPNKQWNIKVNRLTMPTCLIDTVPSVDIDATGLDGAQAVVSKVHYIIGGNDEWSNDGNVPLGAESIIGAEIRWTSPEVSGLDPIRKDFQNPCTPTP